MRIILSFIAGVLSLSAFAQTNKIEGTVVSSDNTPVPYANVWLKNTDKGGYTDINGRFKIEQVPEGAYTLLVSSVGYTSREISVNVGDGQNISLPAVILRETTENLDEVVVNGHERSRYTQEKPSSSLRLETDLTEIPQNIRIVGRELMEDQIAFNIFDGISRNVSGVRRLLHQTTALVNMRGFSVQGLRNGMNISGSFGPMKDDVSFVERFEYVKGPAGFMMGNTAPGGFYNVVTKKPTGSGKNSVALTFGSFDTYRAEADFDGKLSADGKLLYRLNLMGKLQGSHIDYGQDNGYAIAPSFSYLISDKTRVTLEYIHQGNTINNYANYIYSLNDFKEFPVNTSYSDPRKDPVEMNEHNVFINLQHRIDDNWKFTAQAAHLKYTQRGTQLGLAYNTLQEDGSAKRSFSLLDNDNIMSLGQAFVNGRVTTGNVSHNLLGGLDMGSKEYFADWSALTPSGSETDYNIYDPVSGAANLGPGDFPQVDRSVSLKNRARTNTQKNTYAALYLQDEIGFFDNLLRLSIAGRYTHSKRIEYNGNTTENKVFTPRVGLSYSFVRDGSLYGVFDQTFEENYGLPLQDGSALKPSRGSNIEFGIKKNWFDNKLNTTLSIYQITKDNLTTSAGVPPDQFSEQFGEARSRGVELDVAGQILPHLNLVFNYAFTDAEISKDVNPDNVGNPLPGSARHISNTWITYSIPEESRFSGIGFSLGYQWQKDRAAWPAGNESMLPDDYFSLDAGISYKMTNYHISLLVNNITDNYNYTGFFPGAWGYNHYGWSPAPPRNFRLRIAYDF